MDEQFSVREALESGMTKGQLRRLPAPYRGARDVEAEDTTDDPFEQTRRATLRACRAYRPIAPRDYAFSHLTACRILGIPVPTRFQAEIRVEVSVPGSSQPPRRAGVVGHRGAEASVTVGELPVVAPEVAWLQMASRFTVDEMVIAGDFLVRRKRPLSSLGDLRRSVRDRTGMRGIAVARAALDDVRAGTDSPAESRLRLALIRGGLPEPVVGYEVRHEGAWVGTPDLAYIAERIAIEYEGANHRLNQRVYEEDIYRREMFGRADWHVHLVTAQRMRNPTAVVAAVEALLAERRPRERS